MAKKRGLGGLGGSPRTRDIPDLGTYRMGGGPASLEDWIASLGQRHDIRQAYQGYIPSPPSGGATRGLQLPVRQMPPGITPIGYRQDRNVTSNPYWNVMRPGEGRVDPNVEYPMTPDWLPPGMRQRMLPPPPSGLGNPAPPEYRPAPRNWRKNPKRRNWRDIET